MKVCLVDLKPVVVVGLLTFSAMGSGGCERVSDRLLYGTGQRIDSYFTQLDGADRIVVMGGPARLTVICTIDDRKSITAVRSFLSRYPDGWWKFSGPPGDYRLNFYRDNRLIGAVGLVDSVARSFERDTVSFGEYVRRVPATDVEALVRQLNIPWPPSSGM